MSESFSWPSRRCRGYSLATVALAIIAELIPIQPALAANFVATKTADTNDGVCDADCSLREAIGLANTTPGADTIAIPAGTYVLGIANQATSTGENANAAGDLDITDSVTINGSGAATTIIDGARLDQVLHILAGTVTISSVTIKNGSLTQRNGVAGGIENAGTLTLNATTVSGNTWGSGIFNRGTLTLTDSTVSGNHGGNSAGGIYNFFGRATINHSTVSSNWAGGQGGIRTTGGIMTLNNSTVSGNRATGNMAGGILNDCAHSNIGTLTLNNSTVSGNSAVTYGGGIVNFGGGACSSTVTLNNSTVTANSAGSGGGIIQDPRNTNSGLPATVTLKNSIVADNTGGETPNCTGAAGTFISLGRNLSRDDTCLGGSGDIKNTTTPLPGLGLLASNGGPTQTHALLPGSPAINSVPVADCKDASGSLVATDQRGVTRPRPAGGACDIGAFEAN